jgi:LPXTG-motif cell wall-anchored protein
MENKNLIIGIALVGAAIYLYTKRKKEVIAPITETKSSVCGACN